MWEVGDSHPRGICGLEALPERGCCWGQQNGGASDRYAGRRLSPLSPHRGTPARRGTPQSLTLWEGRG